HLLETINDVKWRLHLVMAGRVDDGQRLNRQKTSPVVQCSRISSSVDDERRVTRDGGVALVGGGECGVVL
ncbi:hypothetical protein PanWU01x14_000110, partial [Parasponia andersonii]